MSRPATAVALLALLAAVGAGVGQKPADPKKYPVMSLVGKQAPDFKADFAVNGEVASVADLKGKVVLLDFWAVVAPGSRAALPRVAKLHRDHADKGLEVIGLTRYYGKADFKGGKLVPAKRPLTAEQEQEMLRAFAAHHKLPHRIMTSADAVLNFKVTSLPVAVLIDRKGVVRMVKLGYSPENVKALDAKIKELLDEK
jgi:peroxiredoxin